MLVNSRMKKANIDFQDKYGTGYMRHFGGYQI